MVAISCGDYASLALRSDGTVVAWGNDYYGQTQVPANLSNAVSVADAYQASLALVGSGPPYLTAPLLNRVVADTMPVSFYIQATGTFPLGYQWICHGTNLPGATNAILTLPEVQPGDAGLYSVVVSNALGTVTNSCALQVEPFWITRAPQNGASFPGGDIIFDVVVVGRGLSYQWRFNGIDLPGQTSSSLSLTNVQFGDAGTYSVVVSHPEQTNQVSANLVVSHLAGWGNNSFGQLNVPAGVTNIVNIAAGNNHALALISDGRVVAWGDNSSGQTSVPPGLSNVVRIAAGSSHSLALKSDGTVVGWGFGGGLCSPSSSNVVSVAAGRRPQPGPKSRWHFIRAGLGRGPHRPK